MKKLEKLKINQRKRSKNRKQSALESLKTILHYLANLANIQTWSIYFDFHNNRYLKITTLIPNKQYIRISQPFFTFTSVAEHLDLKCISSHYQQASEVLIANLQQVSQLVYSIQLIVQIVSGSMKRSIQAKKESRNKKREEICEREENNQFTQRQASIKFESKNTIYVLPGRGNNSMQAVTFLQFPGMYYLKMNQTYMQQSLNDLKDQLEYYHGSKLTRVTTQNQVLIICSSKFGKYEQGRKKQRLDQYLECPYCVKFDLEPRDGYSIYRLTYMNFQHSFYCDVKQTKIFYRNKGVLNRYYPQIKKLVLMKKARQETLESPNQLYEIFCKQLGLNPGIITEGFQDKENETPYENDLKKKLKKKLDNIIAEAKREPLNPEDYLSKLQIKKIYGDQNPFQVCNKKYDTSAQGKKHKNGNKSWQKLKKKSYPLKRNPKQKVQQSEIVCTEVRGKKRLKSQKNALQTQRFGRKISSREMRELQKQENESYSLTPIMSTRGLRYNLKDLSNEEDLSSSGSDYEQQKSIGSKILEDEKKRISRDLKHNENIIKHKPDIQMNTKANKTCQKQVQNEQVQKDEKLKGLLAQQNGDLNNRLNNILDENDQLENEWKIQCSDRLENGLFLNSSQKFFQFEQSHRYKQNYLDMLSELSQISQLQQDDISIRIKQFLEPKAEDFYSLKPYSFHIQIQKEVQQDCQSHAFFEQ